MILTEEKLYTLCDDDKGERHPIRSCSQSAFYRNTQGISRDIPRACFVKPTEPKILCLVTCYKRHISINKRLCPCVCVSHFLKYASTFPFLKVTSPWLTQSEGDVTFVEGDVTFVDPM